MLCCSSPPLPFLGGHRGVSLVSAGLYHFGLLLCGRVRTSSHYVCFYSGCPPGSLQCSFPVSSFTEIFFHLPGRGKWALLFLKRCILHSNYCFLGRKHPLQPLKSLNSLLSWSMWITATQNWQSFGSIITISETLLSITILSSLRHLLYSYIWIESSFPLFSLQVNLCSLNYIIYCANNSSRNDNTVIHGLHLSLQSCITDYFWKWMKTSNSSI